MQFVQSENLEPVICSRCQYCQVGTMKHWPGQRVLGGSLVHHGKLARSPKTASNKRKLRISHGVIFNTGTVKP